MSLDERLREYVRACCSGIWIESHEHLDALATIAALCRAEGWQLATWNIDAGLQLAGAAGESPGRDPLAAIRSLAALATPGGTALLVLENFHRFLGAAEIVQALVQQVHLGKQQRTIVVILAPVVQLPLELEKLFTIVEHELPDRGQLAQIAAAIATEPGELPAGAERERLLDAAQGLTRYEAEGAFSLSLVREGRLTAATLWQQKEQLLKKSGLLTLARGGGDFAALGGLGALKAFCKRSLRPAQRSPLRRARGVLLLGVPGTGKSAFAQALGQETGRPTLLLDVGALFGSLVGQTEQNVRRALAIAEAMAPAILFCDEIDKALGGVASGTAGDSGVAARLLGSLLSWMNDRTADVYLIATCNDIARLPPEMSRAERFDGIVFLDLPGPAEKAAIWQLYLATYELPTDAPRPDDALFTGAEIKACCRLAALLDLPLREAAQYVVPVALTAAESVERLRRWASGRCLAADRPGLYQYSAAAPRRRVRRDPTRN